MHWNRLHNSAWQQRNSSSRNWTTPTHTCVHPIDIECMPLWNAIGCSMSNTSWVTDFAKGTPDITRIIWPKCTLNIQHKFALMMFFLDPSLQRTTRTTAWVRWYAYKPNVKPPETHTQEVLINFEWLVLRSKWDGMNSVQNSNQGSLASFIPNLLWTLGVDEVQLLFFTRRLAYLKRTCRSRIADKPAVAWEISIETFGWAHLVQQLNRLQSHPDL